MPSKPVPFEPGDRVVWFKQTPGGGYVFPVLSTVLALTAKRIKIEARPLGRTGVRTLALRPCSSCRRFRAVRFAVSAERDSFRLAAEPPSTDSP